MRTKILLLAGCALLCAGTPGFANHADKPGAEVIGAARKGDEPAMKRLTGTKVSLTGKTQRTLRVTGDYTDVILLTGPDFHLGGGATGVQVVVRFPKSLFPQKLPEQITADGTLTSFERIDSDEQGPGKVAWMPIITISLLK